MSTLGTSKLDDLKVILDNMQSECYVAASQLKNKGTALYAKLNAADIDAQLTLIHGDDAAAKIAYKNTIKAKLAAVSAGINELMDAVKPV